MLWLLNQVKQAATRLSSVTVAASRPIEGVTNILGSSVYLTVWAGDDDGAQSLLNGGVVGQVNISKDVEIIRPVAKVAA